MDNQNLIQQRRKIRIAQIFGGFAFSIALFSFVSDLRNFSSSTGIEAVRQTNNTVSSLGLILLGPAISLISSALLKREKGWSWRVVLGGAFAVASLIVACRSFWLQM